MPDGYAMLMSPKQLSTQDYTLRARGGVVIFQRTDRFLFLPFLFVCLFVCFSRRVRAGPDADASEQLNSFFNFSFGNKFYFLGPERTICI